MLEIIQKLCKEKGVNISKLEKDLGFSNGSIYKWDKTSPSVDKVVKVAAYFNVGIEELLGVRLNVELSERIRLTVMELSFGPYGNREFQEGVQEKFLDNLKQSGVYFEGHAPQTAEEIISFRHETQDEELALKILRALEQTKAQVLHPNNVLIDTEHQQPYYALTSKDERDIAVMLENMMEGLVVDQEMNFMGEPMTEEDRELLRISLENTLRMSKQMAKKKFTPKKYRNED